MTDTTGAVVATPSTRAYGRYLAQGLPVAGLFAAFLVWRNVRDIESTSDRIIFLAVMLVVVALMMLGMLSYLKGAKVTVTPTEVEAVGALWRRRRFPRAEVGVAVEVAGLDQALSMRPAVPMLVLLGRDGRRLLRLNGGMWDTADLDRIARATGAPVDGVGVVTPKQLRARHPGAMASWEAHPLVTALVGALVLVVLVVAVVLLLS